MKKSHILMIVVVALSLVLAACQTQPQSITVSENPDLRTISTEGVGSVALSPDKASISIGVSTEDADAAKALDENSRKVEAVLAALKEFNIEDDDIQTSNFSIYPQQNWDKDGKVTDVTYQVQNTLRVTVRNLEDLGAVLNAVVTSGANNIYGIEFGVADKVEASKQAMENAVMDARERAEVLAAAAGVEVGDVHNITSYSYGGAEPMYNQYVVTEAMGMDVPISAGELTITVNVSVVFEIK